MQSLKHYYNLFWVIHHFQGKGYGSVPSTRILAGTLASHGEWSFPRGPNFCNSSGTGGCCAKCHSFVNSGKTGHGGTNWGKWTGLGDFWNPGNGLLIAEPSLVSVIQLGMLAGHHLFILVFAKTQKRRIQVIQAMTITPNQNSPSQWTEADIPHSWVFHIQIKAISSFSLPFIQSPITHIVFAKPRAYFVVLHFIAAWLLSSFMGCG